MTARHRGGWSSPTIWLLWGAEAGTDGRTRLDLRAESLDWLASMIAILATTFCVEVVDAPEEVRSRLVRAADRLTAVTSAKEPPA